MEKTEIIKRLSDITIHVKKEYTVKGNEWVGPEDIEAFVNDCMTEGLTPTNDFNIIKSEFLSAFYDEPDLEDQLCYMDAEIEIK